MIMLSKRFINFFSIIAVVIVVFSCFGGKGNRTPKFDQYFVQGESLYKVHCSNCHQTDGSGLGRLYPPLNKSDYMDNHFEEVVCLIKNGSKTPIIVNGVEYTMEMKGNPQLTELEVAEIATYIYNSWSHEKGIVEVTEVSTILSQCRN